jgi:hypothetical protein
VPASAARGPTRPRTQARNRFRRHSAASLRQNDERAAEATRSFGSLHDHGVTVKPVADVYCAPRALPNPSVAPVVTRILYVDPPVSADDGVHVATVFPLSSTNPVRPMQVVKSSVETCTFPVHVPDADWVVNVVPLIGPANVTVIVVLVATPVAASAGVVLSTDGAAQTLLVQMPLSQSAPVEHP